MAEEFIEVTTKDNILDGDGKVFNIKRIPIAIFNIKGNFYAINNTCPHMGGSLG